MRYSIQYIGWSYMLLKHTKKNSFFVTRCLHHSSTTLGQLRQLPMPSNSSLLQIHGCYLLSDGLSLFFLGWKGSREPFCGPFTQGLRRSFLKQKIVKFVVGYNAPFNECKELLLENPSSWIPVHLPNPTTIN